VFTSVKTDAEKPNTGRPPLNGYKREFSMPDHFHIEAPTRTSMHHKMKTMDFIHNNKDEVVGESSANAELADSLLSKHHGWITIDADNMDRK
jgi:hypothetical protein